MTTPTHDVDAFAAEFVPEARRMHVTAALFGVGFPLRLEPAVYSFAERLSADYRGGYWHFHTLGNRGFYMAPDSPEPFAVASPNGFECGMSADAFGITACLFAYSHLSFAGDGFAEVCTRHYHLLREFALGHPEAAAILAATD